MSAIHGSGDSAANVGKVLTSFVTGKKDLESEATGKLTKILASVMSKVPRFTDKAQTQNPDKNVFRFANAAWGAGVAVGGVALCVVCPVIIPVIAAGSLMKSKLNEKNDKAKETTVTKEGAMPFDNVKGKIAKNTEFGKHFGEITEKPSGEQLKKMDISKLSDSEYKSITGHELEHFTTDQKHQLDLTKLSQNAIKFLPSAEVLAKQFTAPQLEKLVTHLEGSYGLIKNENTGEFEKRLLDPKNPKDQAYIDKAQGRKNNPEAEQFVLEAHPYAAIFTADVVEDLNKAISIIKDTESKQPTAKAEEKIAEQPAHTPEPLGTPAQAKEPVQTSTQAKTEESAKAEHSEIADTPKLPNSIHELDMTQISQSQYGKIKGNLTKEQDAAFGQHRVDILMGDTVQGETYSDHLINQLLSQVPAKAEEAAAPKVGHNDNAPSPFHELDATKLTDDQVKMLGDKLSPKQIEDHNNHQLDIAMGEKEVGETYSNTHINDLLK